MTYQYDEKHWTEQIIKSYRNIVSMSDNICSITEQEVAIFANFLTQVINKMHAFCKKQSLRASPDNHDKLSRLLFSTNLYYLTVTGKLYTYNHQKRYVPLAESTLQGEDRILQDKMRFLSLLAESKLASCSALAQFMPTLSLELLSDDHHRKQCCNLFKILLYGHVGKLNKSLRSKKRNQQIKPTLNNTKKRKLTGRKVRFTLSTPAMPAIPEESNNAPEGAKI